MTPSPTAPRAAAGAERLVDLLLDAAVVGFGTWTLAADVAVATSGRAWLALLLWAVAMVPGAWLVLALHRARASGAGLRGGTPAGGPGVALDGSAPGAIVRWARWRTAAVAVCVASASYAAVRVALPGGPPAWLAIWVPALLAAVAGLSAAAFSGRGSARRDVSDDDAARDGGDRGSPFASLLVLGVAAGLGVFSLFVLRPDADDVYYVNRAQWVADHGTLPTRDTLFSDQVYVALEHPQVTSYEGLAGAVAHVLHRPAGDIVYYVVPPLATFLATLALWRLLRAWRVRLPLVALGIALLFLVMGGADHTSFGNFFLGRMFQGKVLFVAAVVPLLFALLTEWSRRPTRPGLALLVLTGVAAVGLTSTAVLLVPLIAVAGLLPLALRRPRAVLVGGAGVALYPLATALVIRVDRGGQGAGDFAPQGFTDPTHVFGQVFGHSALTGIALFAVLAGWLLLRRPWGRVVATASALLMVLALAPGLLRAVGDRLATGSSAVLWRLLWVVPAAALVGALATAGAVRRAPRLVSAVPPLALAALILWAGVPIWSDSNAAQLTASPAWKVDPAALDAARIIAARSPAHGNVLAPSDVSGALAVLTTRVHTVDPRDDYVRSGGGAGFDQSERRVLDALESGGVAAGANDPAVIALQDLDVRLACLDPGQRLAETVLADAGFTPAFVAGAVTCYART